MGSPSPAPLFKLRAQPNDWHSEVAAAAKTSSQQAGKAPLYRTFWARFLERVKIERPGWTNAQKPQTANWFAMTCPFKGGPSYLAGFAQGGKLRTELYIDFGDGSENAELFHALRQQKELIEADYGGALSWEELPDKRACRIADYGDGDVVNAARFDEYITWLLDTGTRMRAAIGAAASRLASRRL